MNKHMKGEREIRTYYDDRTLHNVLIYSWVIGKDKQVEFRSGYTVHGCQLPSELGTAVVRELGVVLPGTLCRSR